MMRDLTYAEIFHGGDAESKLVAESLAATLRRIQDFEDGVEYETASEAGSSALLLPDIKNQSTKNNEYTDESDGDRNSGEFFTPNISNTLDDSDDEGRSADGTDESEDVKTTMVAKAKLLRMQPRLMRVVSFSQERCLDLWSGKSEPHYRNDTFVSLMQGATRNTRRKQRGPLTEAQVQLYEDLVRYRALAARRVECLPGFLCSLDDLAFIAWGRPTSIEALRLISYFLPESLQCTNDMTSHLEQMFLLTKESLKAEGLEVSLFDGAVRRYYATKMESKRIHERWSFLGKALIASAMGGIVLAGLSFVRRRR